MVEVPIRTTLEEALQKATRALPGEVLEVGFDDEDGYLVYDVKVATPDHALMEVVIDAGTGEVLSAGADEEDE